MANIDWSQCAAVDSISGKPQWVWVFRAVFENWQDMSVDEAMEALRRRKRA